MIQRETLMQLAYEQLKKEILEGKFKRGETYSTQYFAEYLNISKTPCREALQRLEKEELVELNQAYGVLIRGLTPRKLLNIMQFRSAIDSYCAYYMAVNIDKDEVKTVVSELETLCDKQQQLLKRENDSDHKMSLEWYNLDNSFHELMCETTGNKQIIDQRKQLDGYIDYIGIITANIQNRKQESIDENRELLSVIRNNKPMEAYRVAKEHAGKIYRLMMKRYILNENRD